MRVSKDLLSWKKIGDIFPEIPAWMKKEIPDIRAMWAPDITLYRGKYWLYYAVRVSAPTCPPSALRPTQP